MEQLTERERQVYEYICDAIRRDGIAPSVREISAALSVKSTATVYAYLSRLEAKGCIRRDAGKSRAITLCTVSNEPKRTIKIPILSRGRLISPVMSVENFDGYIDFPLMNRAYDSSRLLALRAGSDLTPGILRGDIVVLLRGFRYLSGPAAVLSDGRAQLKSSPLPGDVVLGMPVAVLRYM